MPVPARPKLYHITHGANLTAIIDAGGLLADTTGKASKRIGMPEVVSRRTQLPVSCHPGTCVGDYVPFYFCPRSVMLYVISRKNHPSLTYRGGQAPIVHLEADLHSVVDWADGEGIRWAFSLANAAESHAQFRCRLADLSEMDWTAVAARQWAGDSRASKQAEFLVHAQVPWSLIERVGVLTPGAARRVLEILSSTPGTGRARVEVRREWYYQGTETAG